MAAREGLDRGRLGRHGRARGGTDRARAGQRAGDLGRAAELQYGTIPELERRLAELEGRDHGELRFFKDEVDAEDVAEVVARWTGIPVSRLLEGEVEKLIHMEARLHERVIGQGEAVAAVSNAIRRSRAGLQDPDRPIGTFLFLGPTGVGKTELARALAEFLFDTQDAMVRIDMSEYMEKHSVSRLVGAPPGYVGYDEGGQLTEAVRRRPYSVVLLDEIEKAHPDVFNVLLQVMDDGRLTDGQGRTVDFKNVVLIMTSNIPGGPRRARSCTSSPSSSTAWTTSSSSTPLDREQIGAIVDLQVERLVRRVRERGVEVELTDAARTLLGDLGYDPTYGARPLKRVIQKHLVDRLALALLEGTFREGDTVGVDAVEGELVLTAKSAVAPSAGRVAPMALEESTSQGTGVVLSAVSNAMVATMKRYYGRGPTAAKTYLMDDYLVVVMQGGFTTVEHTLLGAGQADLVREVRQRFQDEMGAEFMGAVEELTGRRVLGYSSQVVFEPPTCFELFILEPLEAQGTS